MIQSATKKDIPAILSMLGKIADLHAGGRPDIYMKGYPKYSTEELESIFSNPDTPVFCAKVGGETAGYIFCIVRDEPEHPPKRARRYLYIDDLYIDEKFRRQGLAAALLKHAEEFGRAAGCASAELNVWSFNAGAEGLYERAGYESSRRIMEKKL